MGVCCDTERLELDWTSVQIVKRKNIGYYGKYLIFVKRKTSQARMGYLSKQESVVTLSRVVIFFEKKFFYP